MALAAASVDRSLVLRVLFDVLSALKDSALPVTMNFSRLTSTLAGMACGAHAIRQLGERGVTNE